MAFEIIRAENGVQYLRSDKISVPHGFSTRIGGVSRETHTASLNLAFDRGDDRETVLENLRLFADAVGVAPESVVSRKQVHSRDVISVDGCDCGEGYYTEADPCDGYVAKDKGVTLGVKSADCVPILFHDPISGVVGAVHAGWRGTASGIAAECVDKMCSLGADAKNIRVAIGAAIHFCCYEVGEDFLESVSKLAGEEMANRFIKDAYGRLHADIVGMNCQILLDSGVLKENTDVCDMCTCCHPELFYSHRFSHGLRGTMLSVISLGK